MIVKATEEATGLQIKTLVALVTIMSFAVSGTAYIVGQVAGISAVRVSLDAVKTDVRDIRNYNRTHSDLAEHSGASVRLSLLENEGRNRRGEVTEMQGDIKAIRTSMEEIRLILAGGKREP